jgi:hypothetical protein
MILVGMSMLICVHYYYTNSLELSLLAQPKLNQQLSSTEFEADLQKHQSFLAVLAEIF